MGGQGRRIRGLFVGVGIAALLVPAGCGPSMRVTAQTSGEKIFQADKAFLDARDGNASQNAPDDLAVAQGKLSAAKDAFAKQDYDGAARLAEQTVVDAEYARVRAATRKNQGIADGIRKETEDLRQEIRWMAN